MVTLFCFGFFFFFRRY